MIFYFSATGNNRFIAEQIAKATGDTAVSMETFVEKKVCLRDGEQLGIVAPTYFLELPPNVEAFLRSVSFEWSSRSYVFGVVTYGSTSGASGAHMKRILREKEIRVDALYSIITPDTWTVTFDLSRTQAVQATLGKTKSQLERVVSRVKAREHGDFRTRQIPYWVTLFSDAFYQKARHTAHFRVEASCISCGLCEKNCPINAIELQDRKPVWRKDKCLLCLRCLHSCPKFAIQYEDKTAAHGQYRLEKYLPIMDEAGVDT